jgi:Enolase, C-terminal TIM barrel domain
LVRALTVRIHLRVVLNVAFCCILCVYMLCKQGVPLYQHFADLAGNTEKFVMPVPAFNVINGGEHAGNALAFQVSAMQLSYLLHTCITCVLIQQSSL